VYKVTGVQTCALPISQDGRAQEAGSDLLDVERGVDDRRRQDCRPPPRTTGYAAVTKQLQGDVVCQERDERSEQHVDRLRQQKIQIGRASCRERMENSE